MKRMCDALAASGVEVWFDQSELTGGDAWDRKIRDQIKLCALFVPVISAGTNARREGYFRREWKLAVDRTHDMDEALPFLLPVVIDATTDAGAFVPDKFREVQWTRLPGGETNAAFCARVKKMLACEVARVVAGVADLGSASARPATAKVGHRVPAAAWVGAAAVVALAVAVWLSQRRNETSTLPNAGAGTRPPTAAIVAAPVSEARKLVAQAWEQMNQAGAYRAELEIADDLCRRATILSPDDAEAWAAWSHVDCWQIYIRFDRSDTRRESARAKAARALKLDPGSFEARFADVHYLVRGDPASGTGRSSNEFSAGAKSRLRDLLVERPRDARVWFALGILLRNTGEVREAAEAFDRMGETPAFAAVAMSEKAWMHYQQREYAVALEACDRSVALQRFRGNLLLRVFLALVWTGDLELANATIASAPPQVLLEDDFTIVAARVAWWRRDLGEMRRVFDRVPRAWFPIQAIPKGYFLGEAYQMAGEREAATAAWNEALRSVDDQLVKTPELLALRYRKARLLGLLGRSDEATSILRLAKTSIAPVETTLTTEFTDWSIALACGDTAGAMAGLEKAYSARGAWHTTWAMFRYNPLFDPLRGDPRFQALLARAEADPQRCPHAKGGGTTTVEQTSTAKADQKSVAVLAFKNLSDDKDGDYFSEGISEELLNVLAKVPGLTVKARTSSFSYKDKTDTAQEIGRKLTVAHLVDGTVRKLGNDVRVVAHLRRTDTGVELWTDRFDGMLDKPWELQDRIAARIAQELKLKLGDTGRASKTVNPEAHRLVLEARHFWNLMNEDGYARAEAALVKALAIDPQFASAHAELAAVLFVRAHIRGVEGLANTAGDVKRARTEAQRAIEIDQTLEDPYALLGYDSLIEGKLSGSERQLRSALALNPNSATAYRLYAELQSCQGKLDAAITSRKLADELDPLEFTNLVSSAQQFHQARRFDEALERIERATALRADTFVPSHGHRARSLQALGRIDEAVIEARLIRAKIGIEPRWQADSVAISVLRQNGHELEAAEYAAELFKRLPADSYQRGFVLSALGRFDEALPFLERTPVTPTRWLYWDPIWDQWRDDPRFLQLLVKLGRAEEYKVARETLARMLKEQAGKK